jgi:geranylgeranyl pyrophosphate synthase
VANLVQQNIDRLCAEVGFFIPDDRLDKSKQENTIQKALGVLSQDGIFAYIVWLESKNSLSPDSKKAEELTARNIHEKSFELLKRIELVKGVTDYKNLRSELVKPNGVLDDIHQMFLVKQLFERMLTYALYRAKSLSSEVK